VLFQLSLIAEIIKLVPWQLAKILTVEPHLYEKPNYQQRKQYFLELMEESDSFCGVRIELFLQLNGDQQLSFVVACSKIPKALIRLLLVTPEFLIDFGLFLWGI